MGTEIYMSVHVADAPTGLVEELPEFNLYNTEHWDLWQDYDPETKQYVGRDGSYHCYGNCGYETAEEFTAWAKEFTTTHPGSTVTVEQEWDSDTHGEESMVYRAGELVREESTMNGTVPLDLAKMLDEGKAALALSESGHSGGTPALRRALTALIEGLS